MNGDNSPLRNRKPSAHINGNGNHHSNGKSNGITMKAKKGEGVKGIRGFDDVIGALRSHPMLCCSTVGLVFFTAVALRYVGLRGWMKTAAFSKWGFDDVIGALRYHPLPCCFAVGLVFFMGVEYTLRMVPSSSPPFDVGFVATRWLNRFLSVSPSLNTLFAALNTAFVGMQTAYILWVFLVEGRVRPGLAALFMFTCRGILGYSTQLPLPQEFLGSGADFPVGNVSFFLFYSGHVASAVIGSLDMRRMHRKEFAWTFDFLNVLQIIRLLGTRGHYTIDLAVGVGAGILFDSLAGKYESRMFSVA